MSNTKPPINLQKQFKINSLFAWETVDLATLGHSDRTKEKRRERKTNYSQCTTFPRNVSETLHGFLQQKILYNF